MGISSGIPVSSKELEAFIQGDFVRGILARLNSVDDLSALGQAELETFSRMVTGFLIKVAKDFDIPTVINPSMLTELSGDFLRILPDLRAHPFHTRRPSSTRPRSIPPRQLYRDRTPCRK